MVNHRAAFDGLISYQETGRFDAIAAHSRRLAVALQGEGVPAVYAPGRLRTAVGGRAPPAWLLVQYMPFSYGRWGVAPRLIADVLRVRRGGVTKIAVLVHEAWVVGHDARSTAMSAYQRAQLRVLLRLADVPLVTTQQIADRIGRPAAVHLPVGSTVTPTAATRDAARDGYGCASDFVVTLFGTAHEGRTLSFAEHALRALRRQIDGPITLFNLGADAPLPATPDGVRVDTTGPLEEGELSRRLRASDLLLLPFRDGVSTRRTTLMAGLAHGLPVVGLRGEATDDVLITHPESLTLTAAGDLDAFAAAAVRLARHPEQARALADHGRRLYLERFDWPVMARTLARGLAATA